MCFLIIEILWSEIILVCGFGLYFVFLRERGRVSIIEIIHLFIKDFYSRITETAKRMEAQGLT